MIFNPRLSSRLPIEAEASPFPKEETTPPVTKMNLLIVAPILSDRIILSRIPPYLEGAAFSAPNSRLIDVKLLEFLRTDSTSSGVSTRNEACMVCQTRIGNAMLQRAQLLEFSASSNRPVGRDANFKRCRAGTCTDRDECNATPRLLAGSHRPVPTGSARVRNTGHCRDGQ